MQLPRFVVSASVIGTLAGCVILMKDYMSGGRFRGEERMAGKTVIVTGANVGIGKETAKDLAMRGARVIMACRDLDRCEKALSDIVMETSNKNIVCKKCDLSSFASIRAFAKSVNQDEPHLDVLINNAGVMMLPKTLTEDGIEQQIGVNHFGHFLLTSLLLDKLKASAPSRIVIVSSMAYERGAMNFDDLNSEKDYNRITAYGQSKLANVLHANELAKRLEGTGVTANSLHPGVVDTELIRYLPMGDTKLLHIIMYPIKFVFFKTPALGAQTSLRLAIDPALEKVTGKYFSDCVEKAQVPAALDEEAAKRLWAISEVWTKSNMK